MDAREHILEAATELFAEKGFDGTSLQAIADAVGIKKASLLYHFPSKDELRQAVLEVLLARWNEVLPRLLMAAAADEQFDSVIREAIAFFDADPLRARLLLREILDRPDDMRGRLIAHARPWVDVVSRHIRKGQEQGRVHPDVDPEAYILLCVNLIIACFATADSLGVLLPRPTTEGTHARARYVAELVRFAWAGLFLVSRREIQHGELLQGQR